MHSLLQPLLPRAPARSCCPGPPRAALPGGGRKKREGGGRKQKEKGRRMEGTWEDERWSEKGEGVSVTELILDSPHILTCREHSHVSAVHVCPVPAPHTQCSCKPTEHPSRQPLTSLSKSPFHFNRFFFTIQAALTKIAEKSASRFHLCFPLPAQPSCRSASSSQ